MLHPNLHPNLHPFLRLRTRLAHHALLQFAASLRSSLEIIVLACGPVLLGLLACIALPGLYAATLPWPQACAVVLAQSLLACAPLWLLRQRLLPPDVIAWCRALPIAPRWQWSAAALVAAMLLGPLALAYAISTAVWLVQWPDWLRPVATLAVLLTLLSLLLAWGWATLLLYRRATAVPNLRRQRRPNRHGSAPPAPSYQPRRPGPGYYWHQLFWLPCWRAGSGIGRQQSLLWLAALGSVALWCWHPAWLPVPMPIWGASTAMLLMLLTDRGDKAVAEQIARLRPIAAGWPIAPARLFRTAIGLSLLPGLSVTAWFALLTLGQLGPAGYRPTVAAVWLASASSA
ncbi:MAG: hypothetical protein ACEQSK_05530, partial [Sphingomonadaceae bacterium]